MSERSQELANKLEATTNDVIATVENMSEAEWNQRAPADGRQVNVLVDHIASSYDAVMELAAVILSDHPLPPLTMENIDQGNAQHAVGASGIGKDECLAKLRTASANAAVVIRGWSDADLDKSQNWSLMGPTTPQSLVENVMTDHARHHLSAIRSAATG